MSSGDIALIIFAITMLCFLAIVAWSAWSYDRNLRRHQQEITRIYAEHMTRWDKVAEDGHKVTTSKTYVPPQSATKNY